MRLSSIETRLYHIPLPRVLTDSRHGEMRHFAVVTVQIRTDEGAEGLGYTYTVGKTGGSAILALIRDALGSLGVEFIVITGKRKIAWLVDPRPTGRGQGFRIHLGPRETGRGLEPKLFDHEGPREDWTRWLSIEPADLPAMRSCAAYAG